MNTSTKHNTRLQKSGNKSKSVFGTRTETFNFSIISLGLTGDKNHGFRLILLRKFPR